MGGDFRQEDDRLRVQRDEQHRAEGAFLQRRISAAFGNAQTSLTLLSLARDFRYFIKVLELAPPTPEVVQQAENGQQVQGNHENKPMQAEHPSPGINPTENRILSVQPETRSCSVHYPGKFRL